MKQILFGLVIGATSLCLTSACSTAKAKPEDEERRLELIRKLELLDNIENAMNKKAEPENVGEFFTIHWSECKMLNAVTFGQVDAQTVKATTSSPRDFVCGEVRTTKRPYLWCDYLHEKTGLPVNSPSRFAITSTSGDYIFISTVDDYNRKRVLLNRKKGTAVFTADVQLPTNLDYFGLQLCVGKTSSKSERNPASLKGSEEKRSGCCSHHGGVCGCDPISGRQLCCDGKLSPGCRCGE